MTPELRAWLYDLLDAVESANDVDDDPSYVIALVVRLRRELYELPLTDHLTDDRGDHR